MEYTIGLKLMRDGVPFFGPGPARLLNAVQKGASLHQAAGDMGMAYSKAWRIIREAEAALGYALLERQRGGIGGGGSALTPGAVALLEAYDQFQKEMYALGDRLFDRFFAPAHREETP